MYIGDHIPRNWGVLKSHNPSTFMCDFIVCRIYDTDGTLPLNMYLYMVRFVVVIIVRNSVSILSGPYKMRFSNSFSSVYSSYCKHSMHFLLDQIKFFKCHKMKLSNYTIPMAMFIFHT